MATDRLRSEIDSNFDAFQRSLANYLPGEAGRFALMRGGEVVQFYDTVADAEREGRHRYSDGIYSIQEVVVDPVDLGFLSHVGH